MRLDAVWDRDGTIVAATAVDPDDEPAPHPVPADGQDGGLLDVPDEYADLPLDVLCRRLRVDVARGRLRAEETSA